LCFLVLKKCGKEEEEEEEEEDEKGAEGDEVMCRSFVELFIEKFAGVLVTTLLCGLGLCFVEPDLCAFLGFR
jgi:hypothetical protein